MRLAAVLAAVLMAHAPSAHAANKAVTTDPPLSQVELAGDRAVWIGSVRGDHAVMAWDGRRVRRLHRFAGSSADSGFVNLLLDASSSRVVVEHTTFTEGKFEDVARQSFHVLSRGFRRPLVLPLCSPDTPDCGCAGAVEVAELSSVAVSGTTVAVGRSECSEDDITVYDTRGGRVQRRAVIPSPRFLGHIQLAGGYLAWTSFDSRAITLYDLGKRRTVRCACKGWRATRSSTCGRTERSS